MAAVVRDVWPASGPLAGGTHIWLLIARANRGKVSFGWRKCCEPGSSDEAVAREKARAKAEGRARRERGE